MTREGLEYAFSGGYAKTPLLHTYSPVVKADWRGLAAWLRQQARGTTEAITVVVHPSDPRFPREPFEAARYYLSPPFRVILAGETTEPEESGQATTYEVYCLTPAQPAGSPGPDTRAFYGLIVKRQ
jgi:hypothetical protein